MVIPILNLTFLLLIVGLIFQLINDTLGSSLGDKVSNSINGELCSAENQLDKGSCWCYTNPINITCNHVNNLEIFTDAIKYASVRHSPNDLLKIAIQVNESTETINQIITWLANHSNEEIVSSLENLHLSWNSLEIINLNWFTQLSNLKELDLSNNLITTIIWYKLSSLITLNLSHNRLSSINLTEIVNNFPSIERFDVSSNWLKSIDGLDSLIPNRLFSIYVHDNPWDCGIESTIKLGELIYSTRNEIDILRRPAIINNMIKQPWEILCTEPAQWKEMTVEQAFSVRNTQICHHCDCFMIKKDLLMVNCSYRDLTHLPKKLPLGSRIVKLNGNRLTSFSLSSSDSSSWSTVKAVHLNNNEISGLQDLEMSKILRNLLSINLQGNQMKEVPIHILEQFSHLLKVNLSDNPWACDCNTLIFQKWLQKHHEKVPDINKIYCTNSDDRMDFLLPRNKERLPIQQMPISDICPQSNVPLHFLDILSGTCAVLTILIALKVLYDYFWQKKTGKLPYFFKLNC